MTPGTQLYISLSRLLALYILHVIAINIFIHTISPRARSAWENSAGAVHVDHDKFRSLAARRIIAAIPLSLSPDNQRLGTAMHSRFGESAIGKCLVTPRLTRERTKSRWLKDLARIIIVVSARKDDRTNRLAGRPLISAHLYGNENSRSRCVECL